ncbi:MAG TPA: AAC(3) family N-acetyltransferase [Gemmatimonadaceae bacterium]
MRAAKLVASMGTGPVFVHSDPFRTARLVKPVRDRDAYLDAHVAFLRDVTEGRDLWLPTFNYDFPRTRVFDVAKSESQLGPIPERFRVTDAEWRTHIPIFSIAGIGQSPSPAWGEGADPFGSDSIFAKLVDNDGVVLYYGETFHYNTLVHYAERVAGGPVYRYDKIFPGTVITSTGERIDGSLNYHVRPLGTGLDYDWPRLLEEALAAGVCRRLEGFPEILAASAHELCGLWVDSMKQDPFALLDENTRKWAEPAIHETGRRFVITDFESAESAGASA